MKATKLKNNPVGNTTHSYDQKVLSIDRVMRVVKGGRRMRFRALVALGDGRGKLGIGVAKGIDVAIAINKAATVAQKSLQKVILTQHYSIPHEVKAKVSGAHILLKPARDGTGLIAGSVTRQILEVAGYHNIYSKSLGNSNKINLAYAVVDALQQLLPQEKWHLREDLSKAQETLILPVQTEKPKSGAPHNKSKTAERKRGVTQKKVEPGQKK